MPKNQLLIESYRKENLMFNFLQNDLKKTIENDKNNVPRFDETDVIPFCKRTIN